MGLWFFYSVVLQEANTDHPAAAAAAAHTLPDHDNDY